MVDTSEGLVQSVIVLRKEVRVDREVKHVVSPTTPEIWRNWCSVDKDNVAQRKVTVLNDWSRTYPDENRGIQLLPTAGSDRLRNNLGDQG